MCYPSETHHTAECGEICNGFHTSTCLDPGFTDRHRTRLGRRIPSDGTRQFAPQDTRSHQTHRFTASDDRCQKESVEVEIRNIIAGQQAKGRLTYRRRGIVSPNGERTQSDESLPQRGLTAMRRLQTLQFYRMICCRHAEQG